MRSYQQQYKDSVIWEAIIELGKNYDLHFVTQDGDFFEDKKRKELNQILKKECDVNGISIKIYSELEKCLKNLKSEAPNPDYQLFTDKIHECIERQLTENASKNNLRVSSVKEKRITALITEDHDQLAINFEIDFDAIDIGSPTEVQKRDPFIKVSGDCLYYISLQKIVDINLNNLEVHWENVSGEKQNSNTVYLRAALTSIGRPPEIPHTVREKI